MARSWKWIDVTQQNAAMVEQTSAAARSLAQEADELAKLVSRFSVGIGKVVARLIAAGVNGFGLKAVANGSAATSGRNQEPRNRYRRPQHDPRRLDVCLDAGRTSEQFQRYLARRHIVSLAGSEHRGGRLFVGNGKILGCGWREFGGRSGQHCLGGSGRHRAPHRQYRGGLGFDAGGQLQPIQQRAGRGGEQRPPGLRGGQYAWPRGRSDHGHTGCRQLILRAGNRQGQRRRRIGH